MSTSLDKYSKYRDSLGVKLPIKQFVEDFELNRDNFLDMSQNIREDLINDGILSGLLGSGATTSQFDLSTGYFQQTNIRSGLETIYNLDVSLYVDDTYYVYINNAETTLNISVPQDPVLTSHPYIQNQGTVTVSSNDALSGIKVCSFITVSGVISSVDNNTFRDIATIKTVTDDTKVESDTPNSYTSGVTITQGVQADWGINASNIYSDVIVITYKTDSDNIVTQKVSGFDSSSSGDLRPIATRTSTSGSAWSSWYISGISTTNWEFLHTTQAGNADLVMAKDGSGDLTFKKLENDNFDYNRNRTVSVTVAAYNSTAKDKATADYVCDGTSDEVEINAAIVETGAANGGIVMLLPGTYALDDTIDITYDDVYLKGSGKQSTDIKTVVSDTFHSIEIQGASNIVVSDLAITRADSTGYGIRCVNAIGTNRIQVNNCHIEGGAYNVAIDSNQFCNITNCELEADTSAIFVNDGDNIEISSNNFTNTSTPISISVVGLSPSKLKILNNYSVSDQFLTMTGCDDSVISGNTQIAGNDTAIELISSDNNHIINNNISTSTTYGAIEITGTSEGNIISENIIENRSYGILFSNSTAGNKYYNKIQNNVFNDMNGTIITLTSECFNTEINSNKFIGSNVAAAEHGISATSDDNTVIQNNQFTEFASGLSSALIVCTGSSVLKIHNNTLIDNSASNIRLTGCSNTQVTSNYITSGTNGIYIENGTYHQISNNHILSVANEGILCTNTGGAGDDSIITGNIIYNASSDGIGLSGNNITITGNGITHCSGYGVRIYTSGNYCTVTGNTITDNGNAGIYVGDGDYNTVTGNSLYNNTTYEIWVRGSGLRNTITGNNCRAGIIQIDGDYNAIVSNIATVNNTGTGNQLSTNIV
jgi:parallel beta-helix repeat protein